jgi:hypothetical protein
MQNAMLMWYRLRVLLGCLLLLLGLAACGEKETVPDNPSGNEVSLESEMAEPLADEESLPEEVDEGYLEIQDYGQECRTHRYLLPAGAYETLEFCALLPANQEARSTSFLEESNELEDSGVSVFIDYVDYRTITRPYQVWALDYSGYLADYQAEMERQRETNPSVRFDVFPLQILRINGQRIDLIYDYQKALIYIARLDPYLSDKAVGQASREEVARLLGLESEYADPQIQDNFLHRTIAVPLIEASREEELTFMNYSVSVSTPAEGGIRDTRPRSIQFVPDSHSGRGIGVQVTSSWAHKPDPNALFFYVAGPAEYPECYEDDSY